MSTLLMLLDDDDDESEDRPTFPDDPSVQHGHLAGLLSRLERLTSTPVSYTHLTLPTSDLV